MLITQSDRNFYNEHKDEYTHILSIVCPDEKELVKPIHNNHYIVQMWDIDQVLKNKFREYNPPSQLAILATLKWVYKQFINSLKNNEDFRLLVHCDAGVSRSTAMTLGILWGISDYIFKDEVDQNFIKLYIDARKQWCKSLLDWNASVGLCRYIDGRYNPGVKPNQAIIGFLREYLTYFPW